jgi:hypothetical protein
MKFEYTEEDGEKYVSTIVLGKALSDYFSEYNPSVRDYLKLVADALRRNSDEESLHGLNIIKDLNCKLSIVNYNRYIRFEDYLPEEVLRAINFEPLNEVVSIVFNNYLIKIFENDSLPFCTETLNKSISAVIEWAIACARLKKNN